MWDIKGQDRDVRNINKLFCRGANGAMVVADITCQESIEATANWKVKLDETMQQTADAAKAKLAEAGIDEGIPMLLVLNKYDLVEDMVNEGYELEDYMTFDYLKNFAEENGFIGAVCTSAKTNVGVVEAFSALVRNVLLRELAAEECDVCENEAGDMYNQVYEGEEKMARAAAAFQQSQDEKLNPDGF